MLRAPVAVAIAVILAAGAAAAPAPARPTLRFGIDPGIAGSAGGSQQAFVPDDPVRDLQALRRLRVPHRTLVLRLNRLFFSDGEAGIRRFARVAREDTRAGFSVEIQVRYHPSAAQAGDLNAWRRYVRRVVDVFGHNPGVVAMTITNEVNIAFSPNTSDGAFPQAEAALVEGIETAHAEAVRRHLHHLRFGFTYAYAFEHDAAFFSGIGALGGAGLWRAVDFVGLDVYPGTITPAVIAPGDSYGAALGRAVWTLRRRLMPRAGLGARIPIWITENGVPTGRLTGHQQAGALAQLVGESVELARPLHVTDYRWFNLRDSIAPRPAGSARPLFAFDGLLRADYSAKPAFATFRALIARFGSM